MATPRIFVGTLACGEAELEACREAVASQRGVVVTHHVIENLPEWEAHNALWSAWEANKSQHDLFVKVDADTILNRDEALAEIAEAFVENERLTGMQPHLDDYFTAEPIVGPLTVFSTRVVFQSAKSKLFVDHADSNHDLVLRGSNIPRLGSVGWHGKFPNPAQAFHFGLHRKLKKQKDVLRRTALAWRQLGGTGREWALAGAESARWWMIGRTHYASTNFQHLFQRAHDAEHRQQLALRFAKRTLGE